jgi:hypothetical protein
MFFDEPFACIAMAEPNLFLYQYVLCEKGVIELLIMEPLQRMIDKIYVVTVTRANLTS